jgi:hypothetical protein
MEVGDQSTLPLEISQLKLNVELGAWNKDLSTNPSKP